MTKKILRSIIREKKQFPLAPLRGVIHGAWGVEARSGGQPAWRRCDPVAATWASNPHSTPHAATVFNQCDGYRSGGRGMEAPITGDTTIFMFMQNLISLSALHILVAGVHFCVRFPRSEIANVGLPRTPEESFSFHFDLFSFGFSTNWYLIIGSVSYSQLTCQCEFEKWDFLPLVFYHDTIAIWSGNGWAPRWVLASMGQRILPIGWELRKLEHIHGFSED